MKWDFRGEILALTDEWKDLLWSYAHYTRPSQWQYNEYYNSRWSAVPLWETALMTWRTVGMGYAITDNSQQAPIKHSESHGVMGWVFPWQDVDRRICDFGGMADSTSALILFWPTVGWICICSLCFSTLIDGQVLPNCGASLGKLPWHMTSWNMDI